MKIKIEEIKQLCVNVLVKAGLTADEADIVTEEYLEGELRGKQHHGFIPFPNAVKTLGAKTGNPKVIKDTDTVIHIDANGNLGQLVCHEELPKVIRKAKAKGIAMLGIRNMKSYLMPGTFARKAAEQDMIAVICNYGGKARIAPTGSIDPVLAVNPIAFGIPTKSKPIVLDMATAEYAMGKVRVDEKFGRKLPEGVAINKDGKPTIDPEEAGDGAMLPFGGYKGYGLALIIEILSRSMLDLDKERDKAYRGYFFILIDPTAFVDIEKFKDNVEELKSEIKASRKADGVDEIYLPDEQSSRIKEQNLKNGYLEIDDGVVNDIKNLLN